MSSSTTGGLVCPDDPNDTACTTCLKTNCCAEVTTCQGNIQCACYAACLGGGGDVNSCSVQCGDANNNAAVTALVACGAASCGGVCG